MSSYLCPLFNEGKYIVLQWILILVVLFISSCPSLNFFFSHPDSYFAYGYIRYILSWPTYQLGGGAVMVVIVEWLDLQLPLLPPLTLRVQIQLMARCTSLCDQVCQWLVAGLWFSQGTSVSSTNKTDRHDVTEILLKVPLNTITHLSAWPLTSRLNYLVF